MKSALKKLNWTVLLLNTLLIFPCKINISRHIKIQLWESKQTPLLFSSTKFRAWNVAELFCNQILMWSSTVEWSEWESVRPVIDIHIKTCQRRCWDVSKQHSNVQTHADPTGSGRLCIAVLYGLLWFLIAFHFCVFPTIKHLESSLQSPPPPASGGGGWINRTQFQLGGKREVSSISR